MAARHGPFVARRRLGCFWVWGSDSGRAQEVGPAAGEHEFFYSARLPATGRTGIGGIRLAFCQVSVGDHAYDSA